jgi:UDP-N-acetylglucosamine 2-epimerase (non-hydrolysing)/GDP/UDP-N,N'-diacetylbacillosamine 2-epimerase (hydrolysing)
MKRTIASITGTRSDYGLMTPVYRAIAGADGLELHLIVTGMHLTPAFVTSLERVRADRFGALHYTSAAPDDGSASGMARALGLWLVEIAELLRAVRPDIVLLQGDRGEMLAGAIAAAHMNVPVVHMSGGDRTGSIDDSIRNAISSFAHAHLTTCDESSRRLLGMGEEANRIFQVGEPGLDLIRELDYVAPEALAQELGLDLARPVLIAALHPVTTEAAAAGWQMRQLLAALEELDLQTVFTYPNSDAGGRDMTEVLESYRRKPFLRIVPDLGSRRYLSLMRVAAAIVGNSSSGIFEAPSFGLAAVNIGTRQHGRLRAGNVVDVGYGKTEIVSGLKRALGDPVFRAALRDCRNPYGDGHTAPRVVDILKRLRLDPGLLTKWLATDQNFLDQAR